MINKLEQTELWSKFKYWYRDQGKKSKSIWIGFESGINLNPLFLYSVFIKFLEEYFECQLEILSGEEDERYYSFVTKMDHTQIVFKGISGFESIEELILAAFENYE